MTHEIITENIHLCEGTFTGRTLPHAQGTLPTGIWAMTGFAGHAFRVNPHELMRVKNAETGRIWLAICRKNKIIELSHCQIF